MDSISSDDRAACPAFPPQALRRGFHGPSLSLRHNFAVQPGDWLRVEVRDAADAP